MRATDVPGWVCALGSVQLGQCQAWLYVHISWSGRAASPASGRCREGLARRALTGKPRESQPASCPVADPSLPQGTVSVVWVAVRSSTWFKSDSLEKPSWSQAGVSL